VDSHKSNGTDDAFLSKFDSDGIFQWARTWAGTDQEYGQTVATDSSDGIYVAGRFGGTADFDPGPGIDNHTSSGAIDIFLTKFDSAGNFQWARNWGGSGDSIEIAYGIDTDSLNNIYVTGYFCGIGDFDPGPGTDNHETNGQGDAYLTKFDVDGNFLWARTWGGIMYDGGYALIADSSSNIYITGFFDTMADFDPGPGIEEHTAVGWNDAFLSKFDSEGNFQWALTWGGPKWDDSHGMTMDDAGNICIVGSFGGTADLNPGPGIDNHIPNGFSDVFISKFDTNGNFQWARTWGGNNEQMQYFFETAMGAVTDDSNNVFVTGYFLDVSDFDPGPAVDNHASNGNSDVFLVKLLPNGYWE
jgi:hypothetical protein